MRTFFHMIFRAFLPPFVALAITLGFVYFFPSMSNGVFFVLLIATFLMAQVIIGGKMDENEQ